MTNSELIDRAAAILAACSTMTLATSGSEGPWAADVFFASDGLGAHYFISSPTTRHARNLLQSGGCAATVHPDAGMDWRAIKGVQMEGDAASVAEEDVRRARAVYVAKFPFAAPLLGPNSEIAAKAAGTRFFVLRVRHVFLLDNSLGFGNRQEIELAGEALDR